MEELSLTAQRFILHWGEMGMRWGINRSVAQVQALLYLSPVPLPADVIAERLVMARSNVSTSLKELQSWQIVRSLHVPGDRRDHFQSIADPWEMFRRIALERKRRELEPTQHLLHSLLHETSKGEQGSAYEQKALKELSEFFDSTFFFIEQIQMLPVPQLKKLAQMGKKLGKLLGGGS